MNLNLEDNDQVQLNRHEQRRSRRQEAVNPLVRENMADAGKQILYGNLLPQLGQKTEDGIHNPVDFQDAKIRERIKNQVHRNMEMYLGEDVSYEQVTSIFVEDKQKGQAAEGRANQMQRLQKLVRAYPKTSFRQRKKYFEKAEANFVQIDKLLDKLETEVDRKKQYKIKVDIIKLKTEALIARAKAYQESTIATNDEIANIQIAGLYEIKELFQGVEEGDEHANAALFLQSHLNYSEEKIEKKINDIVSKRKSKSGLEIFNEAEEKRKAQYLGKQGEGEMTKQEADTYYNSKMGNICQRELTKINLTENDDALDELTTQSFKKKVDPCVEGALVIRKRLKDFACEMDRNIFRMVNGKPVLDYARTTLDKQYINLVSLCKEYLIANANKSGSDDNVEKTSYEYVKKLKDKLIDKVGDRANFSNRFSVIYNSFIEHRKHTWTDFEDKENEAAIQLDQLEKLTESKDTNSPLSLKSAQVLSSKELNEALGEGEVVSIDSLKKKIDEIKKVEGKNAVPLKDLKYDLSLNGTWAEDKTLLAVDAVLRSCGIFLEGGPRTLLKAIPKSIKNETDVMEHFDKLLYKHNALEECKPLIEKLLGAEYEIKHKEFVVPKVKENARIEYDNFRDELMKNIAEGIDSGAAVLLYDSATKDCVTITGYVFNEATQETTVKVIDSKQQPIGEARNLLFTDLMKDKVDKNKKFTIEYLKKNQ